MYHHYGKKIAFIAHPRTASQAIGSVLKIRGFELIGGHHQFESILCLETTFATIRNPFDLMVSWYYQEIYKSGQEEPFDKWLRKRLYNPNEYMKLGLFPGQGLCTDILHFENLQEEFDQLMEKVGLSPIKIPQKNVSDKRAGRHFIHYYTPELIDLMLGRYSGVIYNNGYTIPEI